MFDSTSSLNSTIDFDSLRRNGSSDLGNETVDTVRYASRHHQLFQSHCDIVGGMSIENRQTFRQ